MRRLLPTICRLLETGCPVFVSIVVACSKGSPGTPGATLVTTPSGQTYGTIGGGILEARILVEAQDALKQSDFAPRINSVEHRESSSRPSGLICGGSQTNLSFVLYPEKHLSLVREAARRSRSEGNPCLEITRDGVSNQTADSSFPPNGIIFERTNDSSWVCRYALRAPRRVLICGAGHCGRALARQLNRLDFEVTLFDARKDLQIEGVEIERLLLGDPPEAALAHIASTESTYLIVMTHSYPSDLSVLQVLLKHRFKFIGLMGSAPKFKRIQKSLTEIGYSASTLSQIHCPVGIEIGSDTPEEIAVSVAAQILLHEGSAA